jgi:predicted nucleotidyltransferase component of viral defense system
MRIVNDLKLPFHLTGETVLSRYYFNHRYSDDLDYFVNDDPNFFDYIEKIIVFFKMNINKTLFKVNDQRIFISNNLVRLFIQKDDVELKLDFVNDISVRFGEILQVVNFGRIDNLRNILSNKISAIYRLEAKDFIDIWIISKNYKFSWNEVINEAKQKEVSIDPIEISKLFKTFPEENLNLIKWTTSVDTVALMKELNLIAEDILEGKENSLSKK